MTKCEALSDAWRLWTLILPPGYLGSCWAEVWTWGPWLGVEPLGTLLIRHPAALIQPEESWATTLEWRLWLRRQMDGETKTPEKSKGKQTRRQQHAPPQLGSMWSTHGSTWSWMKMYKMMETTHTNQANAETTELKNHLGGGQAWLRAGDSGPENTVTWTLISQSKCLLPTHTGCLLLAHTPAHILCAEGLTTLAAREQQEPDQQVKDS